MAHKLSKKFVPIPNTNYTINEYCEIRNVRSQIILHPFLISDYPAVNVSVNGKRKTMYCHHLMSLTFLNHTPKRGLITINHRDHDKTNNRLDNLEIISHRRNTALSYIHKERELPTGVTKTNIGKRRFKSQICYLGINRYLGCFFTPEEAAKVYEEAANIIVKNGVLPEHFFNKERYARHKK